MSTETKHTPEPWERRGSMVYGPDSGPGTAKHIADFDDVDHARRIVACVNACAGMADPEKEVEYLRVNYPKQTDHVIAQIDIGQEYRKQRDALAAALRDLEAWCALATKGELAELSPARMNARAVLARIPS